MSIETFTFYIHLWDAYDHDNVVEQSFRWAWEIKNFLDDSSIEDYKHEIVDTDLFKIEFTRLSDATLFKLRFSDHLFDLEARERSRAEFNKLMATTGASAHAHQAAFSAKLGSLVAQARAKQQGGAGQ